MTSDYTTRQLQKEIVSRIKEYGDARVIPLTQELYRLGYSYKQVGKLLGVSKQAIMKRYPNPEAK